MNKAKIFKCSRCLKSFPKSENDNCEKCEKIYCHECLIYHGELAFCEKCERE